MYVKGMRAEGTGACEFCIPFPKGNIELDEIRKKEHSTK